MDCIEAVEFKIRKEQFYQLVNSTIESLLEDEINNPDRALRILNLKASDFSYRQIGKKENISGNRVCQILQKIHMKVKREIYHTYEFKSLDVFNFSFSLFVAILPYLLEYEKNSLRHEGIK